MHSPVDPSAHLEALLEASPAVLYVAALEPPYAVQYLSPNVQALGGFPAEAYLHDASLWWERVHPDDRGRVAAAVGSLQAAGRMALEYRFAHGDGTYRWVRDQLVVRGGRAYGAVVDVTDRKLAQEQLEQAQALAHLGMWELDLVRRRATWSDGLLRLMELERFDGRFESFLPMVHPEDRARVEHELRRLMMGGSGVYESIHRVLTATGRVKHVHVVSRTEHDAEGVPLRARGTVQDVTARMEAERERRQAEDLLRSVVDCSPDWIFVKDLNHRFLLVNEAFAASQRLSVEAMLGRPDSDFWPPEQCAVFHADDREAFAGRAVHNPSDRAALADGRVRVFDTYKRPLTDTQGRVYGVLCYSRDVTDSRAVAEALRGSLAEKDTLLREIHHRVKNNLQVVSSLLYFHTHRARSPEDAPVFDALRQRILAMTLVHERLYRAEDLVRVGFGDYVRGLVAELRHAVGGAANVVIEVSAGDVRLPIELALPCGMLVGELVTNAFKYAFPDGRPGRVAVGLEVDGDVHLSVADDGVGLPSDFDPATSGAFGWEVVRSLTQQLGGTLALDRTRPGTCVSVRFPAAR